MLMKRKKLLFIYLSKINSKKWKRVLGMSQIPCVICNSERVIYANDQMKNVLEGLEGSRKEPIHDVTVNLLKFIV